MKRFLFTSIAFSAVMLLAFSAEAQTSAAVATDTIVSLKGLVSDWILPSLAAVAMAVGSWVLKKVSTVFHLNITTQNRQVLEEALHRAILWGMDKAGAAVNNGSLLDINVKNAVVANAANYALYFIPGTLGTFGLTKENLPARIEAQLAALLGTDALEAQAAGPSTSPVPVAAPLAPAANSSGPAVVTP